MFEESNLLNSTFLQIGVNFEWICIVIMTLVIIASLTYTVKLYKSYIKAKKDNRDFESKYKGIFSHLKDGVAVCSENGEILEVNDAFEEMLNVDCKQVIGRNIYEFFFDVLPEEKQTEEYKSILQQRVKEFFNRCKEKDVIQLMKALKVKTFEGKEIYVDKFVFTVRIEKGYLIVSMLKNVSDKIEIENELNVTKIKMKSMLNSIPYYACMVDNEGRFIFANNKITSLVHKKEEEIIGKTIESFPDDLFDNVKEVADKVLFTDHDIMFEAHSNFEGRNSWVEFSVSPVVYNNKKIGVAVIAKNITQRKQMEQEIIEAKKAAEFAYINKSNFLANVSHEIRTPMNAVVGFLDLLLDTDLTEKQRNFVKDAKVASDILLNLVNDVLDFSKIEEDKLVISNNPFNLIDAVEDSVCLFAPKAYEKNLSINCFIDLKLTENVRGDKKRLQQIINNLVSNAVKYTDTGKVNIDVVLENEDEDKETVLFKVKDTGTGIHEKYLESIFEPFVQMEFHQNGKYSGTGLGLSISKKLARLMGGDIYVESELEKGSEFILELTFKKDKQKSKNLIRDYLEKYYDNNDIRFYTLIENKDVENTIVEYLRYLGIDAEDLSDFTPKTHKVNRIKRCIIFVDINQECSYVAKIVEQLKKLFDCSIEFVAVKKIVDNKDIHCDEGLERMLKGCLMTPIRVKELFNIVDSLLKQKDKNVIEYPKKDNVFTKNNANNGNKNTRILLVEDNEINRKVFIAAIEGKGYKCDVAVNGKEAVEAVISKDYDIVFMDCQMPVMDGYEATKEIRNIEEDKKHTVIVAMTAYALEGDREKCLESGMDDYISKPVEINQIEKIINKYSNNNESDNEAQHIVATNETVDEFMQSTGIDEESAKELYMNYFKQMPGTLVEIESFLRSRNFEELRKKAHQLKGASLNLRLRKITELAEKLEKAAETKSKTKCFDIFSKLKKTAKEQENRFW